jgi:cell division protein FtsQ
MSRAVVPVMDRSRAVVPQRRKSRRSAWKRWRKPALITALVALLGGVGGGAVYVVKTGGGFGMITQPIGDGLVSMTGMIGLKVGDLLVEGRQMADKQAVLAAIQIRRDQPILGYDIEAARRRLENIPWVETAMVERRLPDTIFVSLTERHPMALWQHNGKFSMIDAKGVEIATDQLGAYSTLPVVVGKDAPAAAEALLLMLDGEPDLKNRVTAAVRVGGRRWNLRLDNRVDVKLPEQDPAVAWSELASLEREQKLLEREIVAVDLRQSDRMVIQLTPEAAQAMRPIEKVSVKANSQDEHGATEKPATPKPKTINPGSTPKTGTQ